MIAQNDHSLTNTVAAPFNPMVSVCDNVYDVANLGQRSLLEVFDAIRGGFCAEQISVIRAVLNGSVDSPETQARLVEHLDHVLSIIPGQPNRDAFTVSRSKYYADSCFLPSRVELVGWLKRALPGVLFSGLFTKRSRAGFQSHSGLICIDIDDLPDAAVKRDEMDSDPHCMCISVSPSGTGLKIVMRVPPTSVKGHSGRTFPAAAAYLLKNYSVVADNATSDVSRLCYLDGKVSIEELLAKNAGGLEFTYAILGAHGGRNGIANEKLSSLFDPRTADGAKFISALLPYLANNPNIVYGVCYGMMPFNQINSMVGATNGNVWTSSVGEIHMFNFGYQPTFEGIKNGGFWNVSSPGDRTP